MLFRKPLPVTDALRAAIAAAYRANEEASVASCLAQAELSAKQTDRVQTLAHDLVTAVREGDAGSGGLDAFLNQYELSSEEGVVLMCLAEALLRIPDAETRDDLIKDKIGGAQWERHLGASSSLFVNASTWALMLTGRLVTIDTGFDWRNPGDLLGRVVARGGEPIIRQALAQGMRILGRQFVMDRTIEAALERARENEMRGHRFSYDMLGEAARTMADADRYFEAYADAIDKIGKAAMGDDPFDQPGISVKLSALHPRYEFAQRDRVMAELAPRLHSLATMAKDGGIGFTVDAEEADRLDISLDVIEAVFTDPALRGWEGFGLAVQAYQKRALPLIDWLADLAQSQKRRMFVRLVKGAYWDTEIKTAQELGHDGYPVFTRKSSTDVSYLACAQRLLEAPQSFYPAFATHNAQTVASILVRAEGRADYEFQRLHGMGEPLYEQLVGEWDRPCRIYAPVGCHEDLLPYVVRRLLENGANSSFVNRIVDERLPIESIIADPIAVTVALDEKPHPRIPLPENLFGAGRRNSDGIDLSNATALQPLADSMVGALTEPVRAVPLIGGEVAEGNGRPVFDPANRDRVVGAVIDTTSDQVDRAVTLAKRSQPDWDAMPADARAAILERAADLYEGQRAALMALAVRESGKTVGDAVAEVREAVDFLRYYAERSRIDFAVPLNLPGPTGETNEIALRARGVFACISPWNFPLAIFTGQIAAALAAGNAVVAKPAEQTPLIAARAVALLHEAGVPSDVLHLLPGPGGEIGGALTADPRIAGVAFTGGTDTAQTINRTLAARDGAIVPLIAETGGQNAMIVDSSALPEQVVRDAVDSAFRSAGQRCSALRVLYLQDDVADRMTEMLVGAMAELKIGDPGLLETDVGPVIDEAARDMLQAHADRMEAAARLIARTPMHDVSARGVFFAPHAFEIDGIKRLEREVFGPILHVVRYSRARLDAVIDSINGAGYGLTLGIHSRIDSTVAHIRRRARVGNIYVNRNQIGAVVGVQPFGGEGLSGTGPKAGGPRYLHRFATERTVSTDTTAAGGNASLLSLQDEHG